MLERMSEHDDASRPSLFASGSPVRTALLVLLAYAVLGAVAGVVWEAVWKPPGQVIAQHQVFYDSYSSLRRVFSGTGLYVVVGALASAVLALVVTLLARGRELLTLGLVIVGSSIAAAVMWKVGTTLGPTDPAQAAAHTTGRTLVSGELSVKGKSPYLVWPMASLLVLTLVFFASPGDAVPRESDDTPDASDPPIPTELPADRQRLVEQLESARFTPVRVRQGYEMDTVDAVLDSAVEAVKRGESLGPVLDVELPTVRWREGYDMVQVRHFLDALRDSADGVEPRR
jgi:hypothetical protein